MNGNNNDQQQQQQQQQRQRRRRIAPLKHFFGRKRGQDNNPPYIPKKNHCLQTINRGVFMPRMISTQKRCSSRMKNTKERVWFGFCVLHTANTLTKASERSTDQHFPPLFLFYFIFEFILHTFAHKSKKSSPNNNNNINNKSRFINDNTQRTIQEIINLQSISQSRIDDEDRIFN